MGGDCDDGLYCTGAESCNGGTCQPGAVVVCDDGLDCTVDSCNEATDSCESMPNDGACTDGVFCNGSETCDPVFGCQVGGDPCPGQECDEDGDVCIDCLVDVDCDDGLFCTGLESCNEGICVAGTPVVCDDGVGCTVDTCNEDIDSCDVTPDDAACDDETFCYGSDTRRALLACPARPSAVRDDGVGCTVNTCNEDTDSCDVTPDDAACDDGTFCNGPEACDPALDC